MEVAAASSPTVRPPAPPSPLSPSSLAASHASSSCTSSSLSLAARYNRLVKDAKAAYHAERLQPALAAYQAAHSLISKDERLGRRIESIQRRLKAEATASSSTFASHRPALPFPPPAPPSPPRLERVDELFDRDTRSGDLHVRVPPPPSAEENAGEEGQMKGLLPRPSRYRLPAALYQRLYEYQRECIHWLCTLHSRGTGGILGDDMGLGKTVQVAALLSLLFHSRLARRVLLLVPVSLTPQWESELRVWCPNVRLFSYSGAHARREKQRLACLKHGGILLTTYGMLASQQGAALFTSFSPPPSHPDADEWDAMILDEGHRIKNPDTRLTRTVKRVSCRFRLILSGTPIQNDLHELWCLMDFACSGRLLGERATFCHLFSEPIRDGSDRNASTAEKHRAQQLAQQLTQLIAPHMLRREKKEVMKRQMEDKQRSAALSAEGGGGQQVLSSASSSSSSFSFLSVQKNELMVWVYLSEAQVRLYEAFISSSEVKAALNSTRSPLAALTVLKKLCDHPRLLHQQMKSFGHLAQAQAAKGGGNEGRRWQGGEGDEESGEEAAAQLSSVSSLDASLLLSESHKLRLLLSLLHDHRASGHRTLVFSQSVKMLDIIACALHAASPPFAFLRLDGSVKKAEERQRRIDEFSAPSSPHSLMLLTTGVGGVGLNLTAADRCVIFDPCWNPAVDSQSVDRCYRLGQQRHVLVYRFITCGTVEEVIYRKQIFKQGLFRAIQPRSSITTQPHQQGEQESKEVGVEEEEEDEGERKEAAVRVVAPRAAPKRGYFTKQELREVFTLHDHRHSATQRQLALQHPPQQRQSYPELELHLAQLHTQHSQHIFGLSDHDLLFQHSSSAQHAAAAPTAASPHDKAAFQQEPLPHSHRNAAEDDNDEEEARRAKLQAVSARQRLLAAPVVPPSSASCLPHPAFRKPSPPPSPTIPEADWRVEERWKEWRDEQTAVSTLEAEEEAEEDEDERERLLPNEQQPLEQREEPGEDEGEGLWEADSPPRVVSSPVLPSAKEGEDVELTPQPSPLIAVGDGARATEVDAEQEAGGEDDEEQDHGEADDAEAVRLTPSGSAQASVDSAAALGVGVEDEEEAGGPLAHPPQRSASTPPEPSTPSSPDSSDADQSERERRLGGVDVAVDDESVPSRASPSRVLPCCHVPAPLPACASGFRCLTGCPLCVSADSRRLRASQLREARRQLQAAEASSHTAAGEKEEEESEQAEWTASAASLLSLPLPAALRVLDCLLSAVSICDASASLQAAVLLLHAHTQLQLQQHQPQASDTAA